MSTQLETTQSTSQDKRMPQKLLLLILPYTRDFLIPFLSFGTFYGFLQYLQKALEAEINPIYILVGAIIIGFFSLLATKIKARARVDVVQIENKVKEIDVTESADTNRTNMALQLFDRGMGEAKEAREHFTQVSKEQRADFLAELKEARNHYEQKENEIRQSYHDRLEESGKLAESYITRYVKLETQLKGLGIGITEDFDIILPESFERRKRS